jgi:hypothetical protein
VAQKDRNIDRHKPGWKRPSRSKPELTFDPETMQDSYLLTRRSMCAWVGISIRGAEWWAANGQGPKITRGGDGVPYYKVRDIRSFLKARARLSSDRDRVSLGG